MRPLLRAFARYCCAWLLLALAGTAAAQDLTGAEEARARIEELGIAAEAGDAEAQVRLGRIYLEGRGIAADAEQAAYWFEKAAEQGSGEGQHNLGLLYIRGRGVPKDKVLAYMWLTLASERGRPDALKARDAMAGSMNPEQLAKARGLVGNWKPSSKAEPQ